MSEPYPKVMRTRHLTRLSCAPASTMLDCHLAVVLTILILMMQYRNILCMGRCALKVVKRSSSMTLFMSTSSSTGNAVVDGSSGSSSDSSRKKRILSGVQPTGALHLGNYLGAIRQWVTNQEIYDNYFCVVDLHAITVPHDPKKLRQETLQSAAMYLASGIDPKKSTIFVQSHVRAHAELAWLLNCITPMNWLERMIQFKEKAKKQGENVGVGLFDYPVLMAADILLYQADLVPVGEDQRQHLELTRDICRRFNDQFCKKKRNTFREPTALIVKEGARVMSLQDGTSKMSKSAENDNSRINLLDSPDTISKKIKRCKTDTFTNIEWDNPDRPECTNLLNIYQAVTGFSREAILNEVSSMSWSGFKPLLADAVVAHIDPIQKRYNEVISDEKYLESVLLQGQENAELVAEQTLVWAKDAMGFHFSNKNYPKKLVPEKSMVIMAPVQDNISNCHPCPQEEATLEPLAPQSLPRVTSLYIMVLTDRQKNDLDLAILEYLSGESSKYAETLSAFKGETGLSDSQIATGKNVLEKKWVSIVRLQKKITELEGTVASLTSQLKTLCGADALINSAGNTPCKENDATKIFPVGPAKGSLLGHRGPVTSVAVHPFYTLIASASEDASIMLWDSETMTYDRAMKGHTGAITSIQFDNTGNTLGSSSVDMTIKLWSTKDFACMKTLRGHDHAISCLQFLHCNEHIASCSRDGSVKYWQISTGYCLHTFTSGSIETWFKTISVSLDNNYIASAGTDRIISVWSLKSKVLVSTLRGHDHVIETLCYGKKPFQVQANDRVETLTDSSSSSTSISDTSDETAFSYLLSGSRDKTIRLWDPLRQTELQKISCHENWVRTVLFTANYKYVISVSDDKSIRVTEIKNSTVYRTILNAHQHFITNACLTYRNSPILITSSIDKSICIWSLQ